jgi:antitoxin FitA
MRLIVLDMCHTCKQHVHMSKMIQLRNVPDALHRKLKSRAALAGLSLSDYLIAEAQRAAERPTVAELRERLARRSPVRTRTSPADAVRRERESR